MVLIVISVLGLGQTSSVCLIVGITVGDAVCLTVAGDSLQQ